MSGPRIFPPCALRFNAALQIKRADARTRTGDHFLRVMEPCPPGSCCDPGGRYSCGLLGHSGKTGWPDPTLVWKRYGHLYPGSTREAIAALDRHLGGRAG